MLSPLPDSLSSLPDSARLWVFTTDRALRSESADALLSRLDDPLKQWTSHGRPVHGAAAVLHDRFLVVAAHLDGGVSGCGIDSLVHAVERAGEEAGVAWLDGLHVAYRDEGGSVQVVPRPAFRALVREGTVTADTPVFVTTMDRLGDLRTEGLEHPAGETWHARVFRIPEAA